MKTYEKAFLFILIAIVLIAISVQLPTENAPTRQGEKHTVSSKYSEKGKKLSEDYCSRCHTYPEPDLLDKSTWTTETLPNMGPRLGIFSHNGSNYPIERDPYLPKNFYPSQQEISSHEWQKIIDYYKEAAPEILKPAETKELITKDTSLFNARTPTYREETPPMVSAIRFDPGNHVIYLSDSSENKFFIFDKDLKFENRFNLNSAMSYIQPINEVYKPGRRELLTTYINNLEPSDAPSGFIQEVWYNPQTKKGGAGSVVYKNLARPVQSQLKDLTGDNRNDLLINEFGHRTGGLFWLNNNSNGLDPKKRTLLNTSGCIQSEVKDFNNDDLPDIIALCTQEEQTINLFLNQGNKKFSKKVLLQFEITAGSSSFELHDFNGDGNLDILYTSGDNADYSTILKPYHGVYIYLNDGKDNYSKAWFFPINGAYKAIARDFNKNGHKDIAVISFFSDYENKPEEGFLFFENRGDLTFTARHHPAGSLGRWIAMDVADWDRDGDDDIVLANFSLGPTKVANHIQNKWAKGPYFLLLENNTY